MPRVDQIITLPDTPDVGPLRLGPADDGRIVTAEEFATAEYAEPWQYERVEGRLYVLSPEGKFHVRTSTPWLLRLSAYALAHPEQIQAVVPSPWVRVSPTTDRIGDIGVYLGGTLDNLNLPDQVPDLLFEFVSPAKQDRLRDYDTKRAEYERVGVREYVIVDRFDRKVTVLTLADGKYAERVIEADGKYESPLLPGLAIGLAEAGPG